MMYKKLLLLLFLLCSCTGCSTMEPIEFSSELLQEERESITVGELSPGHERYEDVLEEYPDCIEYIKEISMYDKEINDTFVIHLSLPPEYNPEEDYPMVVMTDGIWRLKEHSRYREAMKAGELQKLIMVSIGYPDSYNASEMRKREFLRHPESFMHYIADNLLPYLEENYSVDEDNMMLTGHSYGGFFAYHFLFDYDALGKNIFKNYYIGSTTAPDAEGLKKLYSMEEDYSRRYTDMDCNVYFSIGSLEGGYYPILQDKMEENIRNRNYPSLNYICEVLEGYNHEKVCGPSEKRAIYLFYGTKEAKDFDDYDSDL